jgi:hypothetical protein
MSGLTYDFTELFGSTLVGKDGDVSTASACNGKNVLVYFSGE